MEYLTLYVREIRGKYRKNRMDIFIKNESTFASHGVPSALLEVRSFVDVNIWVHTTVTAQYFTL